MRNYFCGWYFRCQPDQQTLAVIPSIHRTKGSDFCTIQLITDNESFNIRFPCSTFQEDKTHISIAGNRFGRDGFRLDIKSKEFSISGAIHFGTFTPLRYDIMGPFRYVPFMQCSHSVFSMHHTANGELNINGISYPFQNAIGYIEGDRGYSFPKEYIWTQCSFPDGALMLSIADIPLGRLRFTGVIGIVYLRGKEYRLATYLGAKAVKISPEDIIVRQGNFSLTVHPKEVSGSLLLAPENSMMRRRIREQLSCRIRYHFEQNGTRLLDLDVPNAALEYEY